MAKGGRESLRPSYGHSKLSPYFKREKIPIFAGNSCSNGVNFGQSKHDQKGPAATFCPKSVSREGQEHLLNPAPQAFVLFMMKRPTFWSRFNVSVIQSHRQAGVKTLSLKLPI